MRFRGFILALVLMSLFSSLIVEATYGTYERREDRYRETEGKRYVTRPAGFNALERFKMTDEEFKIVLEKMKTYPSQFNIRDTHNKRIKAEELQKLTREELEGLLTDRINRNYRELVKRLMKVPLDRRFGYFRDSGRLELEARRIKMRERLDSLRKSRMEQIPKTLAA